MPIPLAVAAPAALASLAYLNARYSLWYDAFLLKIEITGIYRALSRARKGQLNFFLQLEAAAKHPKVSKKNFLLFEGKSYTYAQAYDIVLRYGNWFKTKYGIKVKDIVAMDFENSDQFIWIWYGLWSIGARPAFINYNLTGKPFVHSVKESGTRLCIIDHHVVHRVTDDMKKELESVEFVTLTPELEVEVLATPAVRVPDKDLFVEALDEMGMLIYTSGTTGLPKAAIVSFARINAASNAGSGLFNRGDDIFYTSMPLYHSSAAVLSLCATINSYSTQALGRKFSTKTFWSDCRSMNATGIQYVGETLRYLLAAPPQIDPVTGEDLDKKHSVKVAFGNGLRPDVWNKFKDRFGLETIVELYAATESPFGTWNVSRNDWSLGAVGRFGRIKQALTSSNLKFVKVDWTTEKPHRDPKTGFCQIAKNDEPGEMIYKLADKDDNEATNFQGYFNRDEATDKKIVKNAFKKGDKYFRTGDIGILNRSTGLMYFVDRIGDTFRWKSENVSTVEVSQALGTHQSVSEANVFGVALPGHDGRAGCVAITFKEGLPNQEILRSLAKHVDAELPKYARPLFLRVLSEVGQISTGNNKQQKGALRDMGVDPSKLGTVFWRKGDAYVEFQEADLKAMEAGRVKL